MDAQWDELRTRAKVTLQELSALEARLAQAASRIKTERQHLRLKEEQHSLGVHWAAALRLLDIIERVQLARQQVQS